ncbi:MAG: DNA replication and repair protein RecF [Deltaproteobacteria bacterium]|nr:DNA replication and repair protein RecF [Deltaproteobacteria bacterium]
MRVVSAILEDFRNLSVRVDLACGINVFVGRNGQGKTNFLEALFVACMGRSFRPGRLADLVRFSAPGATVELGVEERGIVTPVRVSIAGSQRRHRVGGRDNCSLSEVAQMIRAVFFGPDDLDLVKGSPSGRRSFLDEAIRVHHPPYERLLMGYQRLLRDRNQLLRDFGSGRHPPEELLASYEGELARWGGQIVSHRSRYLRDYSPMAVELVARHTGGQLTLELAHECTAGPCGGAIEVGDAQEMLLGRLRDLRGEDIRSGSTTVGPHLDDLRLDVNGRAARLFASQGEQRQVAVSMKLAQLALWRQKFGVTPLLLLDDVLSELDSTRIRLLLDAIAGWQVQAVLTTTAPPDVVWKDDDACFRVKEGGICRVDFDKVADEA